MAAPMTDITGYRTDGGGLGQDQGLSGQLKRILTAKLPLLNAPGTVLENSLYYDTNSSSVTAVEEQATFGKDRIALNNFTMGSSPAAYIPSVLFAGTLFWVASLMKTATWKIVLPPLPPAILPNNRFTAPHGWGFHFLRNVIVYMGSSNIAQIQISGKTNYMIAMACCETDDKRQLIMEGAGKFLCGGSFHSPMSSPLIDHQFMWSEKNYGNYYTPKTPNVSFAINTAMAQCVVPVRLPFTSMCVLNKRLSFDTKLLTQPIQITLETRQRDEVLFVQGEPNFTGQFQAFEYSTLQLWQEELSDKSLSVRNELLAMPEFNIGWPFQYAQSIPFTVPGSSEPTSGNTQFKFDMNITSIINSDLTTFLFFVQSGQKDLLTIANGSNGSFSPLMGEELLDIELLLNGQQFFRFNEDSYKYVTMAKQISTTQPLIYMAFNTNNNPNIPGATGTVSNFQARSNIYEFNNSRLRSLVAEADMQNTARFTNQTFQLAFRINRAQYFVDTQNSYSGGYTLHMCYLYNGVFLVGGDGGTTKLITN